VLLVVVIAGILSRSSWVKTDLNWLFSASALPKLSEMGDPLTVIVEIVCRAVPIIGSAIISAVDM